MTDRREVYIWGEGDLRPIPAPLDSPRYMVMDAEREGDQVRLTWAYASPGILLDGTSLVGLDQPWQDRTGAEWLKEFRKL
jgi:hypothetical protein